MKAVDCGMGISQQQSLGAEPSQIYILVQRRGAKPCQSSPCRAELKMLQPGSQVSAIEALGKGKDH